MFIAAFKISKLEADLKSDFFIFLTTPELEQV